MAAAPSHQHLLSEDVSFTSYLNDLKKDRCFVDSTKKEDDDTPPFVAGWLGYLAFDAAHDSFGLMRRPTAARLLPAAWFGWYDWSIAVDCQRQRAWLCSDGGLSEATAAALQRQLRTNQGQPRVRREHWTTAITPPWSATRLAWYADAFARIQEYLRAGDAYQVNLTRRFCGPPVATPWQAYRDLLSTTSALYSAYLEVPGGTIVCASPERLLSVRHGLLCSQPIKGTAPRTNNGTNDLNEINTLSSNPKDRSENVMIVDLVRNDLAKVAETGSVTVPELCAVRTLRTLHHLQSTVTARLAPGVDAVDALAACFPAGSISGAPKRRALQIIAETEIDAREVYCGAIGYLDSSGNADFNVAIRTLLATEDGLYSWAGGGIVADSVLEDERAELDLKAAPLRALSG